MKIRVLGAYGAEGLAQRPSAFLVDDTILIDGGTVGGALSTAEQIQIEHALITHSHLDHVSALADVAKHMTPERIRRELDKLPGDLPVLIYHVKPQFKDEIGDELGEIAGHRISFAEQDKTYLF